VGNIVFGGVGRGVLLGGGRDNKIHGNIFINLPIGIHVDARGPRGITLDRPGSWNLLAKCLRSCAARCEVADAYFTRSSRAICSSCLRRAGFTWLRGT
jgi:hypothetical protein